MRWGIVLWRVRFLKQKSRINAKDLFIASPQFPISNNFVSQSKQTPSPICGYIHKDVQRVGSVLIISNSPLCKFLYLTLTAILLTVLFAVLLVGSKLVTTAASRVFSTMLLGCLMALIIAYAHSIPWQSISTHFPEVNCLHFHIFCFNIYTDSNPGDRPRQRLLSCYRLIVS